MIWLVNVAVGWVPVAEGVEVAVPVAVAVGSVPVAVGIKVRVAVGEGVKVGVDEKVGVMVAHPPVLTSTGPKPMVTKVL